MSEGTPGHGPDAEPRTDSGDGQASTNGRPVVPPVRYGPRNGSPANGANGRGGATGRTVPGSSSPQQYRAPQPPRPANGGSGSNGSTGSNGAHPVTPGSYTRPRPSTSARPEPSEQERLVTEARTAAAARNASAAKVRGAASPQAPTAPVDDTAVIPAVAPEKPVTAARFDRPAPSAPETSAPETEAPGKGRNVLGRLRDGRDRRALKDPQAPQPVAGPQPPAAPPTADTPTADTRPAAVVERRSPEPELRAEPGTAADETKEQEPATEGRQLTWRDRLGLSPKESRPQPVHVPETDPGAAAGTDAVATTSTVSPAAPETRVSPTGPDSAPQPDAPRDRVSPSAPVPGISPDTAVIPAVDAGAEGAAAPTGVASPPAAAKPKVGAARRTRKARLRLSRVDPWSVMKTALLFSIAAGIILVVATYGVWSVLNASGLFDAVNDMVKSVVSTPGDTTPFRIEEYVNTQKIIGVAALIAVVDVLIFTALATLGSFLYNLAATVLGGLEVTLAED